MKFQILVSMAVFAGLMAGPLSAQSKATIPYTDMSTAQALVDTLAKENESLKAEADKLEKEAASIVDQITGLRKWLTDLAPLLEETKAKTSEIYTVAEDLVDRDLVAKSQAAKDKSEAASKKILARMAELQSQIADLDKQIEPKLFQAAVNQAKINRNNDDIVLLQATLSRTKIQEGKLTAVILEIDSLQAKVDSFLQQSGTPAAAKK